MPYSVQLYLNFNAESAICQLQEQIAENVGELIPDELLRPQLTLAAYEDLDTAQFEGLLRIWAAKTSPFVVHMPVVGAFPQRPNGLFLAIAVTQDLLNLHRAFHRDFKNIVRRPWAYFLPDNWSPHIMLLDTNTPRKMGQALTLCLDIKPRITGTIESIGLYNLKTNERIFTFDLMGEGSFPETLPAKWV